MQTSSVDVDHDELLSKLQTNELHTLQPDSRHGKLHKQQIQQGELHKLRVQQQQHSTTEPDRQLVLQRPQQLQDCRQGKLPQGEASTS